MTWTVVAVLGTAVLVGAVVQSVVGFGMSVVAAPVVVLVAPDLMPVTLLVASVTLPVVQLTHGVRDLAWRPLGWALLARAVSTAAGVAVVALLSARAIAALVGVLILVTVALSVRTLDLRPTTPNALGAGAISGISGTAAAIGGPFLALVLQHERPERVRATMAAFFLAGSSMGLVGLALGGEVHREQLLVGLTLLPFVVVGYALATPVRRRIDPDRFRRYVLGFCVVASVTVITRALLA